MILTDREIKLSIASGQIRIDPTPDETSYASTSLDLTLASEIRVYRATPDGAEIVLDPSRVSGGVTKLIHEFTDSSQIESDGHNLKSGHFILGWTREKIDLQKTSRIAARVEGKSSLARLGVAVHVTAPTIHSGFKGPIQLEIKNHGPLPIKLRPCMKICQLIFEMTLGMPDRAYEGQFLNQGAL